MPKESDKSESAGTIRPKQEAETPAGKRTPMEANGWSRLVIPGLLAVLGTVAGGVVQGYWDTSLARMKFQSDLVLRALESEETDQRIASLRFLVKANLIEDQAMRDGLQQVLEDGGESIPQFRPVGVGGGRNQPGVDARAEIEKKFPTLQGKNVALVGFRVRHGDIIDAIAPIYSAVTPEMELVGEFEGDRIGGTDGGETVLKRPGHVVTGFEIQRGRYFGRSEVVHLQVTWSPLTADGIGLADSVVSERLGSGNFAEINEPPKRFQAGENAFISNFSAIFAHRTSGETFISDIEISETVVILQ